MTDDERALLEFEERLPRDGGKKLDAIRAEFDVSAARYYQSAVPYCRAARSGREVPDAGEAHPMTAGDRIDRSSGTVVAVTCPTLAPRGLSPAG